MKVIDRTKVVTHFFINKSFLVFFKRNELKQSVHVQLHTAKGQYIKWNHSWEFVSVAHTSEMSNRHLHF